MGYGIGAINCVTEKPAKDTSLDASKNIGQKIRSIFCARRYCSWLRIPLYYYFAQPGYYACLVHRPQLLFTQNKRL